MNTLYIGREKCRRAALRTEKSDKPAYWTPCSYWYRRNLVSRGSSWTVANIQITTWPSQARRPRTRDSIPVRCKRFFCYFQCPDWLWDPASLPTSGYECFFGGRIPVGAWRLTTHLHLVSRLKVHGDIPPLLHTSLWHDVWLSTGTTGPLC
jgi:hypothetical protein